MSRVKKLIRQEILDLTAYPVPNANGMIKLDAMENPYSWPAVAKEAWTDLLKDLPLNRYPDASAEQLKLGLKDAMGIDDKFDVLLGNGSDEIIQMLAMAVAKPGATILAPEPGFVMYKMIATFCGLNYVGVPLTADFELDETAMLEAVNEHQPELIFLAQPNNPTGNLWDRDVITRIIEASKGLVIMDEAYTAFTDEEHLDLLDEHEHVLVMRTLSKVGLAGLRLGLLIGRSEWLNELEKIRMPYNINMLTQASALFALENYDMLMIQTEQLRVDRVVLMKDLAAIQGVQVFPSEANFILVRVPEGMARNWFEGLKERNILIKCLDGGHPLLKDCLRITVGTTEQNEKLIEALSTIAQSGAVH
ncbi:histidinol-phosphate transaminase [Bermanella marisrubri]|uniref:Histidinol-phosphate aminotransferase n=1 Tax=Bermanella marisrubri TaxID=207949 RepID=Q1MYN7_9GAMM|nr:histidinol-phosphate transaminase [Bermanella marisrubri]EAT11079.1 histidinol-phosphate aminotransferase [Oceanobacter sp. RED65] [Bermanella marisrubri]